MSSLKIEQTALCADSVFPLADSQAVLGADHRRRFIAVAPNGGRRTLTDHPALPITPEALAATAKECLKAGAAMMHVHIRDRQAQHILDADGYRAALNTVKAVCGDNLVLQITTEALGRYEPQEQRAIVREVRPEAASLAFRELARDEKDSEYFADLLRWIANEGVAAQVIIYDTDDLSRFRNFMRKYAFAPDEISVLYVLGRYSDTPQGLHELVRFASFDAPLFRDVMVCAFGVEETACLTAATLFGANVRVGFENNLWLSDGELAPDNAALVKSMSSAIAATGLRLGTAHDLRRLWAIQK